MIYPNIAEIALSRIVLRKLKVSDAPDLFRFGGDPIVSEYMLWSPHRNMLLSEVSIETSLRAYGEGRYYRWGIALKENDMLIGIIQFLNFNEEENSVGFAYMLNKEYWNCGYGTESVMAVIEYAFEKMQVETVKADHFSKNTASGAVMQKCGMKYVKTVKDKYEKNGILYDADEYMISRSEWSNRG